ncbi:MAG TPA: lysoplasmalogenase [Flavobacterium sp.]|nr:lysoplasmalogenase [Flavobacterium sp.]
MTKKTALFVFLIFSLLYLGLVLIEFETITWWLKPFIIPLLSISVFLSGKLEFKPLLISALFFSWIGDVVLLFANQGVIYFIIGLVSFLIAHLFYIVLFSKLQKVTTIKYKRFIPLVLLYLFGLLSFLWEKLGGMKIPVIIYALVISTMLLVAIKGYFTWNSKSGKLLLIGAVFFVLSDSILAINKFYVPIYLSSFWIMSTYITAQFLIVKGVLNLNSKQ